MYDKELSMAGSKQIRNECLCIARGNPTKSKEEKLIK